MDLYRHEVSNTGRKAKHVLVKGNAICNNFWYLLVESVRSYESHYRLDKLNSHLKRILTVNLTTIPRQSAMRNNYPRYTLIVLLESISRAYEYLHYQHADARSNLRQRNHYSSNSLCCTIERLLGCQLQSWILAIPGSTSRYNVPLTKQLHSDAFFDSP